MPRSDWDPWLTLRPPPRPLHVKQHGLTLPDLAASPSPVPEPLTGEGALKTFSQWAKLFQSYMVGDA
jgi:hypothetical protein